MKRLILAANRSTRGSRKQSSREILNHLIRCKSSNLWGYAFDIDQDADTGTLYVQFKNPDGSAGDIYRYYDVPFQIYRKLIASPSKGHGHWKYIRNKYKYSKLTGDKRGKLKNAIN